MTSIRHFRRRVFAFAGAIAAASTFLHGAATGKQTLVVTTAADDGAGSLRQALRDAAAGDTITFAPTLLGDSIGLTTSEIALTRDVTISGPGANLLSIGGRGGRRIFTIAAGVSVSLSGVTLGNGRASDGKGGAIRNEGTLLLADAAIVGSSVIGGAGGGNAPGGSWGGSGGGGGGGGGAVYNAGTGTLTIERSTLRDNVALGGDGGATPASAPGFGGGGAGFGGAIANDGGVVIVRHSTLSGNRANGGHVVMTDDTAAGPADGGAGGGGFGTPGTAGTGSNGFAGGAAGVGGGGGGGGLETSVGGNGGFGGGGGGGGTLAIGGNGGFGGGGGYRGTGAGPFPQGEPGFGGGRPNDGGGGGAFGGAIFSLGGSVTLTGVTITANRVIPGNGASAYGGGIAGYGAAIQIRNSIVAANDPDLHGADAWMYAPAGGSFVSNGALLLGCADGLSYTAGAGDQVGASCAAPLDPLLRPLANYGGPTDTHGLQMGSPALDTGDNVNAGTVDQRGFTRVVGSAIDIGAYEDEAAGPAAITQQPVSTSACHGGPPVSFSVGATGTGLQYQWRFNGVNVDRDQFHAGDRSPSLVLVHPIADEAGTYDVVVTGLIGSAISAPATLTVSAPPSIASHPGGTTGYLGGTAIFTATGSPSGVTQRWQLSTDGGTTFSNIPGATGPTLIVSGLTLAMSGNRYRAVFTDTCGQTAATQGATLTVLPLDAMLPPAVSLVAGTTSGTQQFVMSQPASAAMTVTPSAIPGLTFVPNPISFPTGASVRSFTVTASGSATVGVKPITWTPSGSQYGPAASSVTVTSTITRPATLPTLFGNETSSALSYTVGSLPDTGETMTLTPSCGVSNPTCAGVLEFTPSFLTFTGAGAKTQTLTIKALAAGTATINYVLGGSAGAFYATPASQTITVNPPRTITVPTTQLTVLIGAGINNATGVSISSNPTAGTTLVLTPDPIPGVTFTPGTLTFTSTGPTSQFFGTSAASPAAMTGDYTVTFRPSGSATPQYTAAPTGTIALRLLAIPTRPLFPSAYVNQTVGITVSIPSPVPSGTSLTLTPAGVDLIFTPSSLTFDGTTTSQTLSARAAQPGTKSISYSAGGTAAPYYAVQGVTGSLTATAQKRVTIEGLSKLIAGESRAMPILVNAAPAAGTTLTVTPTVSAADADKISISPPSVTFTSGGTLQQFVTVTANAATITTPGPGPLVGVLTGTDAAGYTVQDGSVNYVPQLTLTTPVYPTLAIGQTSAPLTVTLSDTPYSHLILTPHAEGVTFTPADITWTGDPASLVQTFTATATSGGTKTVTYTLSSDDAAGVVPPPPGTIVVGGMPTITTVTCPASVVYTGASLTPCTVTVTATDGLNLTPDPVYANNIESGTATATYVYAGDAEHAGSSDSKTFSIARTASTTTVTCPASLPFTGDPVTPCNVSVTGAGGLNLTPAPSYASNTNVGTATAVYAFAGDENHTGSSGSASFAIVDVTAPVVTVPANVTLPGAGINGSVVTFSSSAADTVDGAITPSCAPASGSLFAVGDTVVTCTASDRAGNRGSASFTIRVLAPVPVLVPGVMQGSGALITGMTTHRFELQARKLVSGGISGLLRLTSLTPSMLVGGVPVPAVTHAFASTAVTSVSISDDPYIGSGSDADTALFAGTGRYDGVDGYTFEVRAIDRGTPGPLLDELRLVIRDGAGAVVLTLDQRIDSGSISGIRSWGPAR